MATKVKAKAKTKKKVVKPKFVYVLRANTPENTSYGGFQWPESGIVTCPDWKRNYKCGNGLHGFLPDQQFNIGLSSCEDDGSPFNKFLLLKVASKDLVRVDCKVKFSKGEIIKIGDLKEVLDFYFDSISVDGASAWGFNPFPVEDESKPIYSRQDIASSAHGNIYTTGSALTEYGDLVDAGDLAVSKYRRSVMRVSHHQGIMMWILDGKVHTAQVGKKGIKADVWYKFDNNKIQECEYEVPEIYEDDNW